jgi:hypothetical protein
MLMIAAGYADGNDVASLRADAMFKLALIGWVTSVKLVEIRDCMRHRGCSDVGGK